MALSDCCQLEVRQKQESDQLPILIFPWLYRLLLNIMYLSDKFVALSAEIVALISYT